MDRKIIACDLGTGGSKSSLYNFEGQCLASVFVPYDTHYSSHGWHEQKPADWWDAFVRSTKELMKKTKTNRKDIICCAVAGHSLGAIPVDRKGNLLRESVPIWSDTRAVNQANDFFRRFDKNEWYMITGNGVNPAQYPIFKLQWYRENQPEVFRQIWKVLGTKDYINYKLCGKMLTDSSYASGSGAFDIVNWSYSEKILNKMSLPLEIFPNIVSSSDVIGSLTREAAEQLGLTTDVQVIAGGVDNSCMAIGAKAFKNGRVYVSLGSSNWIAVTSNKPLLNEKARPYVFTVAPNLYTSALCIASGGTSFRWVRDQLCKGYMTDLLATNDAWEAMNRLAADSPIGANKLIFNPSLSGGMPMDKSLNIRGGYLGLDLKHTTADLVRSAMEGIALSLKMCYEILSSLSPISSEMLFVGGGSKSAFWRQIYADCLNETIIKTNIDDQATALGAAACGAVGTGLWSDYNKIDEIHKILEKEHPILENAAKYEELYAIYKLANDYLSDIGDKIFSLNF